VVASLSPQELEGLASEFEADLLDGVQMGFSLFVR